MEGGRLPVDIGVEGRSLRAPVGGVLAAGLVNQGVDLRYRRVICDGVQLLSTGVQNLVVVVLLCLLGGVVRVLPSAAGGQ